jgi:hypothetical protein
MVSTVYTRIYEPLPNKIYHSEADLNAAILQQLNKRDDLLYQKKRVLASPYSKPMNYL